MKEESDQVNSALRSGVITTFDASTNRRRSTHMTDNIVERAGQNTKRCVYRRMYG